MKFLTATILIAFQSLVFCATRLPAQQETAESAATPKRVVVFRINAKTLKMAVDRTVRRTIPMNETTKQATITGTAHLSADVSLDFAGGTVNRMPIRITGCNDIFARADAGPIVAQISGQVPFTLDMAIGFDGQREFYALPACARANTCLSITCIDTKRRRLGRRIVRGVASRVANKKLPEAEASTSRSVEQQLVSEADKELRKMVQEINESFKIEETLTAMAAKKGYEFRLSKSQNFLQVRVAPPGQSTPVPPTNQVADVPFEVWIYPTIEKDELTDKISEFWDEAPDELIELLPQDVGAEGLDPEEQIKMQVESDWTVIRVGDFESINEKIKKVQK